MVFSIFIIILLILAAIIYVAGPLLQTQEPSSGRAFLPDHSLEDLQLKKQEILLSLKDLQLDHDLKKISDEDFKNIYDETVSEGTEILKQIDEKKS